MNLICDTHKIFSAAEKETKKEKEKVKKWRESYKIKKRIKEKIKKKKFPVDLSLTISAAC